MDVERLDKRAHLSCILFFFLLSSGEVLCAETTLRGVVRDALLGSAIPGANIEVLTAKRGAISDADGSFAIDALDLPVRLRVTHVGYAPTTVEAELDFVEVQLRPIAYEMTVTEVDERDPAVAIMRKVLAKKAARAPLAAAWRSEAYTRQTLYRNLQIAALRESAAEIFTDPVEGWREQVKAHRASANTPDSLAIFSTADYLFDLSADEITLFDQTFPGPTHPRALSLYAFQLTGQSDGLYHLAIRPHDSAQPGFSGSLVIGHNDYALREARLRPNRRPRPPWLPTATGLGYVLEQRFSPIDTAHWLPIYSAYEMEGQLHTSATAEPLKRARGAATTTARLRGEVHYTRRELSDTLVERAFMSADPVVVETPSATWDKLLARELPPPNRRQQRAYKELEHAPWPLTHYPESALFQLYKQRRQGQIAAAIQTDPFAAESLVSDDFIKAFIANSTGIVLDSTLSLAGAFPVPIPAAARGKLTSELWANRVDALHFGLRWRGDTLLGKRTGAYFKGGYNTGHKKPFYALGFRRAWGRDNRQYAGAYFAAQTHTRYASTLYSTADNSYPFLLSLDDYFDFYWRENIRLEWGKMLGAKGAVAVGLNAERHAALRKETDFNLLCGLQPQNGRVYGWLCRDRDRGYRANPTITIGDLHSVDLQLRIGGDSVQRRLELDGEYAFSAAGGDFSFARLGATLDWQWQRGDYSYIFPKTARYRLRAGAALGPLPPQRRAALDVGIVALAPFGAFKTLRNRPYEGREHTAFFYEWRWGSGLFERLVGYRAWRWGLGWALHGGHGRTWAPAAYNSVRRARGWHHETGLSLTVLDYFNIDTTWRLDRRDRRIGFSFVRPF